MASATQLPNYKANKEACDQLTMSNGCPVGDRHNVQTVGDRGPMLMHDILYMDELAHFDRERIPERVVHAKGGGAHGYFEVTHDITKYCKAKLFEKVGKKTPCFVRFSTVGGESGSADTARDPRGFAVKLYTEEGNWDLVGNNTPIFFIRDPILFPVFIHTQKRNPATHLKDPTMTWDFFAERPETTHQVSFLYSCRGTPDGFRRMNGYGSHTFKMVNAEGEAVYAKFHWKTDQGIKNLTAGEAEKLAGSSPDYAIKDLYDNIQAGNFPSWSLKIQVMTFEQAENWKFNPFDLTKIWPHSEFPLIDVGKMVLNRNPKNYFQEVEQSAFSPSHMVPGIETSPDKMLQGRLFSYPDTHIYRLGVNYQQLEINCPYKARVSNYQRDGAACLKNQEGAPNYSPNTYAGPMANKKYMESTYGISGDVTRYNTADDDNFTQVNDFWTKVLTDEQRQELVDNIAGHLSQADEKVRNKAIGNFTNVNDDYGRRIKEAIDKLLKVQSTGL